MDITIPSLGDIDEVEVIELCVAPGDYVEENDTLLVIESDKASMDLPASVAGTVDSILVAVGDMVSEGHAVAVVTPADAPSSPAAEAPSDTDADSAPSEAGPAAEVKAESATTPADTSSTASTESQVEVLVPDIGDAGDVVVIEIAVQAGDEVAVNDLLVVLESDKASMEIAAEQAGTILAVAVSEGQQVEEGTHIATLRVLAESVAEPAGGQAARPEPTAAPPAAPEPAPAPQEAAGANAPKVNVDAENGAPDLATAAKVYAGPAVRRLARELGVDLSHVTGTGNRQRITKDDVKAYVKNNLGKSGGEGAGAGLPQVASVDYARFGPVTLTPLTRIQQRGADNLHRSWVNLPHVTQHDEADITDMEEFRKSLKQEAEQKGVKLTPLAFLVKACCHCLREYPMFNSSLHEDRQQLVVKDYINIGMAVDTPEGLVVPVIRQADTKNLWTLSAEIAELSEKARNKKLGMDDVQGGTFSISSLGALGGTGFTPIVNAPEVAILGVAKLQTKPLWDGSAFVPRKVLPLSLSYDHRVINGADGGRFMLMLTTVLSDIRRMAL